MAAPNAGDGKPVFHSLPRISDVAVADLLQVIRARLLRFLIRRHALPRWCAAGEGARSAGRAGWVVLPKAGGLPRRLGCRRSDGHRAASQRARGCV